MPRLFFASPLCNILLTEKNGVLTSVEFCGKQELPFEENTPLLLRAKEELLRYLGGELKRFNTPVMASGTPFMLRVWAELIHIPYGKTLTYRQLAEASGSPKGCRAAGQACNRNPLPIFIPCHRVLGTGGSLTGYEGGLEIKRRLLALEQTGRLPPAEENLYLANGTIHEGTAGKGCYGRTV